MDEKRAREILDGWIDEDNGLSGTTGSYLSWWPMEGNRITLDGEFNSDELEAISWWIRNKIG